MLNLLNGKTVLVTGHTGFKGSWLTTWLVHLGANVVGFSLAEYENDFIFKNSTLSKKIVDERGNVADIKRLQEVFKKYSPDLVFHLAAQPLVRLSYDFPIKTIESNTLGTANVLECIKEFPVKAAVVITTDKVYKNKEQTNGYVETDEIGGHDPYSASKAAAENLISSYRNSFFSVQGKLVATVRAGNVVGGGDFSADRLIPDCIKSIEEGKPIIIRNPAAVRPWQHVLEPLSGYLLVAQGLLQGKKEFADAWNFAPSPNSIIRVDELVKLLIDSYGSGKWEDVSTEEDKLKYETKYLSLDASKAKEKLSWEPQLEIKDTVKLIVDWYKKRSTEKDWSKLCLDQIEVYEKWNV